MKKIILWILISLMLLNSVTAFFTDAQSSSILTFGIFTLIMLFFGKMMFDKFRKKK